jgi:aspartyl-tRNA(Asn)/glutamyl-tRNA(Gln) amidotransferase subunit C
MSVDAVRRIARLARLDIPEERLAPLASDLSAVVTYVDRLRALDLSAYEPMTNVAEETNRLDPDEPGPSLPTAALLAMAPAVDGPFVRVPKVLGDTGGGA